jgi:predicted membrane protein
MQTPPIATPITVWGPAVWNTLHVLSFHYRPDKKNAMHSFVNSLPSLLPCPSCGTHMKYELAAIRLDDKTSPPYESTDKMIDAILELHNNVNRRLGKRAWSRQQLLDNFEKKPQATQLQNDFVTSTLGGVVVLLLILVCILLVRRRK